MTARLRAAVIGRTGRGDYGHSLDLAWTGLPDVDLVAVADDDSAGLHRALQRTGAPRGYASYRDMLARERPHFASVAPRWVDCHAEMMLACAEAGVRGILCEKPFVRTPAEADAVLEACLRAGTRVAVAHQSRAMPPVQHAARLIREGALGRVHTLIGHGKGDHRGGAEDLFVLGTHILDLMRFLLAQDPEWVSARVQADGRDIAREDARPGNEGLGPLAGDSVAALYAFPGGATALFESSREQGSGGRFGLEVHGTRGLLVIRAGEGWAVWHCPHPFWPTQEPAQWRRLPDPDREAAPNLLGEANRILARDLIAAAQEDRDPLSSGADGRWAVEMILGAFASQLSGRRMALPLADRGHPLAEAP